MPGMPTKKPNYPINKLLGGWGPHYTNNNENKCYTDCGGLGVPTKKRKIIIMPISRKRQRSRSRDASQYRYAPRKMRIYRAPRTYTPSVYRFKRQIQLPISVNQSTGFSPQGMI